MQEGKRNKLEAELKKMLRNLDEAEARKQQVITQTSRTGNVIRRRQGQEEKRFSV